MVATDRRHVIALDLGQIVDLAAAARDFRLKMAAAGTISGQMDDLAAADRNFRPLWRFGGRQPWEHEKWPPR